MTHTFKVQGQVYHTISNIYSVKRTKKSFYKFIFIEDLDLQTQTKSNNDLDKDLITELQFMLHQNNIFIKNLKWTIESIPHDCVDLKIIIWSDKKPVHQHARR